MEIVNVPIVDIVPYKNNPRKNDKAVDVVAKSIKEFGFKVPIILEDKNVIVCGHTRVKAAIKLGITEVPVIYAEGLTKEQIKAFRIMDNKSQDYAEWDMDLLKVELDELNDLGFDLDLTGFGEKEVEEDNFDTEKVLKNPKYDIKIGDIYQLGEHKVMCGDSINKLNVDKLYTENINLILTSPPYNMGADMYQNYKDNLDSEDYINLNLNSLKLLKERLIGFVFWNLSYNKNSRWEFMEIFNRIRKETELIFMELIVWNKKSALPISSKRMLTRQYEDIALFGTEKIIEDLELYWVGSKDKQVYFNKKKNKGYSNYWELTVNNTQLDIHKACYPVKLAEKAIELTTEEGDIVADVFGGSGTTLIACEQMNRKCFMMELDTIYCSVIIERWEELTGNKAIKSTEK